jgi:hypothetical protein
MLKLPDQTDDFEVTLSYNIGEFYKAALEMADVALEKKTSRYRIDRTSKVWNFERWCEEVVWWCHKGSRYLYEDVAMGEQDGSGHLAGHY